MACVAVAGVAANIVDAASYTGWRSCCADTHYRHRSCIGTLVRINASDAIGRVDSEAGRAAAGVESLSIGADGSAACHPSACAGEGAQRTLILVFAVDAISSQLETSRATTGVRAYSVGAGGYTGCGGAGTSTGVHSSGTLIIINASMLIGVEDKARVAGTCIGVGDIIGAGDSAASQTIA